MSLIRRVEVFDAETVCSCGRVLFCRADTEEEAREIINRRLDECARDNHDA